MLCAVSLAEWRQWQRLCAALQRWPQHGALFRTINGDETMDVAEVTNLLAHAHVGVEAARCTRCSRPEAACRI